MILVLIMSIFNNISAMISAQEVDMMLYNRDVNGVETGTILTREMVIAEFGEPSGYEEQDSGDNGIDKYYYYGDNYIHTNDDVFDEFAIRDNAWSAFTNHIEGGVKVGDPLSKLDTFKYGKPIKKKETRYRLFYTSDNPVDIYVEEGVIVGITYHDPV